MTRKQHNQSDKLMTPREHPPGSRLLLCAHSLVTGHNGQPYSATILEYSPTKRYVHLLHENGNQAWVNCWDYTPVVIEILSLPDEKEKYPPQLKEVDVSTFLIEQMDMTYQGRTASPSVRTRILQALERMGYTYLQELADRPKTLDEWSRIPNFGTTSFDTLKESCDNYGIDIVAHD